MSIKRSLSIPSIIVRFKSIFSIITIIIHYNILVDTTTLGIEFISLDILFINEDNKVFKIVKEAPVKSQENINSISPAKYVLELLGGQADALEIEEGAQIKLIEK